jgi:ribosome biogenesis protein NSA1
MQVPEDMTRLAVPVWHTDLCFCQAQPQCIVSVSGLYEQRLRGEVRVYDVRAQHRRPATRVIAPMGELALSALALSADGHSAFVGTVTGELGHLDMRKGGALVGGYKGAGGAVVCLALDRADGSRLYSASLDRHVRVHSVSARKLLVSAYLKQRQRALALLEPADRGAHGAAGGDGNEATDEDEATDGGHGSRAAQRAARESARAADADAVEQLLGSLARTHDGPDGELAGNGAEGESRRKRPAHSGTKRVQHKQKKPKQPVHVD